MAIVWVVNPRFRTVTVYRPGAAPVMFSGYQELTAEPHLPGFRVPVDRLWGSERPSPSPGAELAHGAIHDGT